jgi:hypothetical protein
LVAFRRPTTRLGGRCLNQDQIALMERFARIVAIADRDDYVASDARRS